MKKLKIFVLTIVLILLPLSGCNRGGEEDASTPGASVAQEYVNLPELLYRQSDVPASERKIYSFEVRSDLVLEISLQTNAGSIYLSIESPDDGMVYMANFQDGTETAVLEAGSYDMVIVLADHAGTVNVTARTSGEDPEAEYHDSDLAGFRGIGNARYNFRMSIPQDWTALDISVSGDGYQIVPGNDRIDMRVYGSMKAAGYYPQPPAGTGTEVAEFTFDSGVTGWKMSRAGFYAEYAFQEDQRVITLWVDYSQDPDWMENNLELVETVARSLRSGTED